MTGKFSKVCFYGIDLEARRCGSLGDRVRKGYLITDNSVNVPGCEGERK